MVVKSGKCFLESEFMILLSSFLQSIGWSVNKQNDKELYFKNKRGEFLQYLSNFTGEKNSGGSWVYYSIFTGATGFDESKEFEKQPGYAPNNRSEVLKGNYYHTTALPFSCAKDMQLLGYTFVGDEDLFFIQIEIKPGVTCNFFSTTINKTHDINGGHFIYSGAVSGWGAYGSYYGTAKGGKFTAENNNGEGSPFQIHVYSYKNGFYTVLLGGSWHQNEDETSANTNDRPSLISYTRVVNNLHNFKAWTNDKTNIPLISGIGAFDILKINKGTFTGLNILVKPQFFYLNDINKWVHCGGIDKIRVVGFVGLKNKQILTFGNEKFMVFEPTPDGNRPELERRSFYSLAVKL